MKRRAVMTKDIWERLTLQIQKEVDYVGFSEGFYELLDTLPDDAVQKYLNEEESGNDY
jgi:hypothetical protein